VAALTEACRSPMLPAVMVAVSTERIVAMPARSLRQHDEPMIRIVPL